MSDEDFTSPLREGLFTQPVPEVSPDFDARVLAAITRPRPWWTVALESVKPALPAALGSMVVMFALIQWSSRTPLEVPHRWQKATATGPAPDIERILLSPNLNALALARDAPRPRAVPKPPPGRRSAVPAHTA